MEIGTIILADPEVKQRYKYVPRKGAFDLARDEHRVLNCTKIYKQEVMFVLTEETVPDIIWFIRHFLIEDFDYNLLIDEYYPHDLSMFRPRRLTLNWSISSPFDNPITCIFASKYIACLDDKICIAKNTVSNYELLSKEVLAIEMDYDVDTNYIRRLFEMNPNLQYVISDKYYNRNMEEINTNYESLIIKLCKQYHSRNVLLRNCTKAAFNTIV